MKLCPNCHKNEGIEDQIYGVLPCNPCFERLNNLPKPGDQVEFITEEMFEDRKKYADDIEQPHRKGELNKKWVDLWGADEAIKHGYSQEEIDKATYVYSGDNTYYKEE